DLIGPLSLTANSKITLGMGAGREDLTFASATQTGGTLTIDNWVGTTTGGASAGEDRILFTSTATTVGLTAFLANVQFTGYLPGAHFVNGNELAPLIALPEPATVLAGCFLLG